MTVAQQPSDSGRQPRRSGTQQQHRMVRVVLVRHGTTESNLRDARMAISIARGDLKMFDKPEQRVDRASAPDAMKSLLASLGHDEQSGDTNLSTHKGGGREQAQLLADYWAPILQGKAEAGELHVHVSAMQRCMQTIDPLMKVLGPACGLTASIQPRICEVPGLCHPDDKLFLETEVFARFAKGDDEAGRAALSAHAFQRCGLSKAQISAQVRKRYVCPLHQYRHRTNIGESHITRPLSRSIHGRRTSVTHRTDPSRRRGRGTLAAGRARALRRHGFAAAKIGCTSWR
jgi:hypothetical protein